jgi:hypothetical protein
VLLLLLLWADRTNENNVTTPTAAITPTKICGTNGINHVDQNLTANDSILDHNYPAANAECFDHGDDRKCMI